MDSITMLQETSEPDIQANEMDPEPFELLRLRVQRLEESVAALQDTHQLEERLLGKLAKSTLSHAADLMLRDNSAPPPSTITAQPPAPVMPTVIPPAPPESRWLLFESLSDFSAIWRMFFDWKYRFLTSTRLIVYGLLGVILTTHLWFPLAWLFWPLGGLIDKLFILVPAFFVYKALSREARRYRLFLQMNRR